MKSVDIEREILKLFYTDSKKEVIKLRFSQIKNLLLSEKLFEKIDVSSVSVILSRKLKILTNNKLLNREDKWHQKVFYFLTDKNAIKEAK